MKFPILPKKQWWKNVHTFKDLIKKLSLKISLASLKNEKCNHTGALVYQQPLTFGRKIIHWKANTFQNLGFRVGIE